MMVCQARLYEKPATLRGGTGQLGGISKGMIHPLRRTEIGNVETGIRVGKRDTQRPPLETKSEYHLGSDHDIEFPCGQQPIQGPCIGWTTNRFAIHTSDPGLREQTSDGLFDTFRP